ncbi:MAG: hypothetical protein IH624_13895 [Phycisphaerae bacterium]|nr:hypothetical protein [Phycisphaerae bacterium]
MARQKKDFITITEPPPLKRSKLYPGRILAITQEKKAKLIRIRLENLDPVQLGRIHTAQLSLAVWPGNRTSQFFAAAGIDTTQPGEKISIDDCIGETVGMRFTAEEDTVVTFEPFQNKRPHSHNDSQKEQGD